MVKLEVIDTDTGEVLSVRKGTTKRAVWMKGFKSGHADLALAGLTQNEFVVYHLLLSKIGYGNYVNVSLSELADIIKCSYRHVSGSVSSLVSKGVIEKIGKKGSKGGYRVNKAYVWCGGRDG